MTTARHGGPGEERLAFSGAAQVPETGLAVRNGVNRVAG